MSNTNMTAGRPLCSCETSEDPSCILSDHNERHFVPERWTLQYGSLAPEQEKRWMYLEGHCDHCYGASRYGIPASGSLDENELFAHVYQVLCNHRPYDGRCLDTGCYHGRVSARSRWYQRQDDLPLEERNEQFVQLFHEEDQPAARAWVTEHHGKEKFTKPRRDRKSTLFYAILERMRADGCMAVVEPILDYILPKDEEPPDPESDTYLTNYEFDLVPHLMFGSSEGIYVDLCLEGSFDAFSKKLTTIGTFKTLRTDLEACRLMGELCGMLMYHGTAYVNENIHRYTPTAELEAEYRRYAERQARG